MFFSKGLLFLESVVWSTNVVFSGFDGGVVVVKIVF